MILVTGGTGMLGTHLLWELHRKKVQSIRAIYRTQKSLQKTAIFFQNKSSNGAQLFAKIRWVQADITDKNALEKVFDGIQIVYHLAALVSFDDTNAQKMQAVNVGGTENILKISMRYGVKHFVYVSSIATLSKTLGQKYITENAGFDRAKSSVYGRTKHKAEVLVWMAIEKDFPAVIVNPGVILGGGFWAENAGVFFKMIYKRLPFFTNGVSGFVDASDVAKIMIETAEKTIIKERFILVSENISYRDFLNLLAKYLGRARPFIPLQKWMIKIITFVAPLYFFITRQKNILTADSLDFLHSKSFYKNEKAMRVFATPFTPMATVIEKLSQEFIRDLQH